MLRKLSYGAPGLALGIPAIPLLVYLPVRQSWIGIDRRGADHIHR